MATYQEKFSPPKQDTAIETIIVRIKVINADAGANTIKNAMDKMHKKQNIVFVFPIPFSFKMVMIPKIIGMRMSPNIIHRHSPNGTKFETGKFNRFMYR